MYSLVFTNRMKRDLKLMKKRGKDISKLEIVPTEVSSELIKLHVEIFKNGCVCVGFVEPEKAFISRQAAVHNRMSNTGLQEGHFNSFDDAFSWAKEIIS